MTEDGAAAAAAAAAAPAAPAEADAPLPPLPDGVVFAEATAEHVDEIVAHNCAMAKETEGLDIPHAKLHPGVRAAVVDRKAQYYVLVQQGGAGAGEGAGAGAGAARAGAAGAGGGPQRVLAQLMITMEWSDWRNAWCWWIQSVYVPEDWRRRGLWRALYARVKKEALKAGACGLRLYAEKTNTRAQSAYTSLGMTSHYLVYEDMLNDY